MSDWNFLNRHRVRSGMFASTPDFGFNGAFMFSLPGEARIAAIKSRPTRSGHHKPGMHTGKFL